MAAILKFTGQYAFLSNFYQYGVCVEILYQASKASNPQQCEWVMLSSTPGEAKSRGRQVEMWPDWDEQKLEVMSALLQEKFSFQKLRSKLLDTGARTLVEGNWWHDTYWGICNGQGGGKCPGHKPYGENHLGRLLMELRSKIRYEMDPEYARMHDGYTARGIL